MIFSVSGSMLRFTGYKKEIVVEGATVLDGLRSLAVTYPTLKSIIFDRNDAVKTTHRIFVNGSAIPQGDATHPVGAHDRVDVVTTISGG